VSIGLLNLGYSSSLRCSIEDIASVIDDPSDGLALEANPPKDFEDFASSKVDNESNRSRVCFFPQLSEPHFSGSEYL
jgi:hypothetical protein